MEHDVCIVGAGAAGLTLAHTLARRGRRVLLIEGDRGRDGGTAVGEVGMTGRPHRGWRDAAASTLGGTTTLWGGQLWPWEPHEFEPRPYVPLSGWPISYEAVAAYYPAALGVLGVREGSFSDAPRAMPLPPLDRARFAYKFSRWASWRNRNLGRTIGRQLLQMPNVTLELGSEAAEIVTDATGSRALGVKVRTRDNSERTLQARTYVIAGGTLGNTRLLLSSRRASPGGVGNRTSWVGRCFMDHLSVRTGRFVPTEVSAFNEAFAPVYEGGVLHTLRFVLQPDELRGEGLLGCCGHWETTLPHDSAVALVRAGLRDVQAGRRPHIDVRRLTAGLPDIVRLAWGIGVRRRRFFPRQAGLHLRVDVEQPPDPDSRLRLEGEGVHARLVLDWRVSERERQTVRRFTELLAAELDRLGVGRLDPDPDPFDDAEAWGTRIADSYHMMGGTRMSATPESGVVDADGRVHEVENLFAAGASVFPTGGTANPTLTLMALALRLGDHLNARLNAPT